MSIFKLFPATPTGIATSPKNIAPPLPLVKGVSATNRSTVFQPVDAAKTPQVIYSLERPDRIVFMLLDGKRTVQDIARIVRRNELDITWTLVRLLRKRYIEYAPV